MLFAIVAALAAHGGVHGSEGLVELKREMTGLVFGGSNGGVGTADEGEDAAVFYGVLPDGNPDDFSQHGGGKVEAGVNTLPMFGFGIPSLI